MNKTNLCVALVTGASSGIGHATAKALQKADFRVSGTSRRAVAERSDGVAMLSCDVTDDGPWRNWSMRCWPRPDALTCLSTMSASAAGEHPNRGVRGSRIRRAFHPHAGGLRRERPEAGTSGRQTTAEVHCTANVLPD